MSTRGNQPLLQRGVERHDARLEREAPGQVQHRPPDVGDPEASDRRHLVVAELGHVATQRTARLARRGWAPGDVHLIERCAPDGQAEEDGGRR